MIKKQNVRSSVSTNLKKIGRILLTQKQRNDSSFSYCQEQGTSVNSNHLRNLDIAFRANVESHYSAWSYFHLLQGMHEGSKGNPSLVERFERFFDQAWRAIFDDLFAKVGSHYQQREI